MAITQEQAVAVKNDLLICLPNEELWWGFNRCLVGLGVSKVGYVDKNAPASKQNDHCVLLYYSGESVPENFRVSAYLIHQDVRVYPQIAYPPVPPVPL